MKSTPEQSFEQLMPADAQVILERLPERISMAFSERAEQLDFPVEAVLEMALAGYLDRESIAFVDCKPNRGTGKQALLN